MTVDLAKTPSSRLDGRRALVTGGGRGIGLAAASALAAAGAHVTLAARTKAEIEEAAAAIRARGEEADALVLDVTDVEAEGGGIGEVDRHRIALYRSSPAAATRSRAVVAIPVARRRMSSGSCAMP